MFVPDDEPFEICNDRYKYNWSDVLKEYEMSSTISYTFYRDKKGSNKALNVEYTEYDWGINWGTDYYEHDKVIREVDGSYKIKSDNTLDTEWSLLI